MPTSTMNMKSKEDNVRRNATRKRSKKDDEANDDESPKSNRKLPNSRQPTSMIEKQVVIRSFIQKTCTPVSYESRTNSIKKFLETYMKDECCFDEKELEQIWKGLYYALWYTEMKKGCEDIIEAIAKTSVSRPELLTTGFKALSYEWKGIDYIRLDKFAYLVRRLVNAVVKIDVTTLNDGKDSLVIDSILQILEEEEVGLTLQVTSVYTQEVFNILKHAKQEKSGTVVLKILSLMKPFLSLLTRCRDKSVAISISQDVILESVIEVAHNNSFDFDERDVLKYTSFLIKMIQAFQDSIPSGSSQQKHLRRVINDISNSNEIEVLLEARSVLKGRLPAKKAEKTKKELKTERYMKKLGRKPRK